MKKGTHTFMKGMLKAEAQELHHSLLWESFCREIDYRITLLEQELRTCEVKDVIRIRDGINLYDSIKNIPEQVIERDDSFQD